MPRRSTGPRYYPSKQAWYANLNGERIKLAEGPKKATKEQAQERWDTLSKTRQAELDGDRAQCQIILNAYLNYATRRTTPPPLAPSTYRMHQLAISSFTTLYGDVRVRDLRMSHFQDWLSHYRQPRQHTRTGNAVSWGESSVTINLSVLITAFKWASHEGELIGMSPFERRGMKAPWPQGNQLKKKTAITQEEHEALLAQADKRADKNFALLLLCLYHTGPRPAEMYLARKEEWDEAIQGFVIDPTDPKNIGRLKTRKHLKKRGHKRTIRIPSYLVKSVKEAMKRFPTGPIFRDENGKVWTAMAIADRFKSLVRAVNRIATVKKKREAPVRDKLSLYSYRHGFATRFIVHGGNPMVLCELMNTSLAMLRATYSHLFEEHAVLLEAVNQLAEQDRVRNASGSEHGPQTDCPKEASGPAWAGPAAPGEEA